MRIDEINIAIASALLARKAMTASDVQNALAIVQESGHRLDSYINMTGALPESTLLDAVAEAASVPLIVSTEPFDLSYDDFEPATAEFFADSGICPVKFSAGGLLIAVPDPFDQPLLQMLGFHLGQDVQAALCARGLISDTLLRLFSPPIEGGGPEDDHHLVELAQQGPVVALVQDTLAKAAERGASDVHIEALEHGLQVRFRIGGFLSDIPVDRAITATAIITRLKVLAELNISERRMPQDGRFRMRLHGRNIDFRMSTLPTQFGESVVLRLLDQSRAPKGLDDLGMDPEIVEKVKNIIAQPNGLFLVTGPTGSGKTTTLYAALQRLNQRRLKVFSVEDPIEYSIAGVNQVQVNTATGLTFAKALRAILRQDPDIVMIGEIRDAETAQIACRAALVGRLVLSTLHTNTPTEAKTRLLDLGVPCYMIEATLRGVLGQSLVPVLCNTCFGKGCGSCANVGFSGRQISAEIVG
ncbi:MAG: type II/IV secretion system protein [Rhodobacteraceae bacterium]|nr:type II/IV secretion system protein [Paracoccaceae bacterium]